MRKLYFMILCWIENIKAAIHCKRCGFPVNKINVLCEFVNLRDALHLLSAGFEPVEVDHADNGGDDTFYFRRTAALLMALDAYRKAIRETVNAVDYEDFIAACGVPGSRISFIDDTALANMIVPRGHVREAMAYEGWPETMRHAYVKADADTRRRMVNTAYQRG